MQLQNDPVIAEMYDKSAVLANIEKLAQQLAPLCTDAFGTLRIDQEYMTDMLADCLVCLATHREEMLGFVAYKLYKAGGEKFFDYSTAIAKQHQGHGVGSKLLETAISMSRPSAVVAKSQNPAAIYSGWKVLHHLGAEEVYPIDDYYTASARAQSALKSYMVFKHQAPHRVNQETGLQTQAFHRGRLGDYEVKLEHTGVEKIEQRLQFLGLNRKRGDAVHFLGFLKQ